MALSVSSPFDINQTCLVDDVPAIQCFGWIAGDSHPVALLKP